MRGTELLTTWHSDIALDMSDGDGDGRAEVDVDVDVDSGAWGTWDVGRWGLDGGGPLRRLALRREDGTPWGGLCEGVVTVPLLLVPQRGSCGSSGRAWRLRAARHSQGRGQAIGRPATASGARARRLQSRRLLFAFGLSRCEGQPTPLHYRYITVTI